MCWAAFLWTRWTIRFTRWSANYPAAPLGDVADAVIVDIHAEASSEKQAMGFFCDGRASLVVGSHTHVPTADTHILVSGTAYQTDAGMCGDYNSVIGMEKEEPLTRFTTVACAEAALSLRRARGHLARMRNLCRDR